jgi:sulfur carrier protein ThiS
MKEHVHVSRRKSGKCVPDKCTVRDLVDFLKIPKVRQKSILVIVNDEPLWNSTRLREDDVVKVLPVMGGG